MPATTHIRIANGLDLLDDNLGAFVEPENRSLSN